MTTAILIEELALALKFMQHHGFDVASIQVTLVETNEIIIVK